MRTKGVIYPIVALILLIISLTGVSAWYGGATYGYGFGIKSQGYSGDPNRQLRTNEPIFFHLPDECWSSVNMTEGEFLDLVITYNNETLVSYWYDVNSINTYYGNNTAGLYARLNITDECDMCLLNYNIYCNANPTSNRPSSLNKEYYVFDGFENLPDWTQAEAGTDPT